MRPFLAWLALGLFSMFVITLVLLADAGRGQLLFILANQLPAGDKLCHVVLFGTLALLANVVAKGARMPWGNFSLLKGNLFVLIPTVLEELSQLCFPSRSFELLDLAADGLGIFLGGWLALLVLHRWKW